MFAAQGEFKNMLSVPALAQTRTPSFCGVKIDPQITDNCGESMEVWEIHTGI